MSGKRPLGDNNTPCGYLPEIFMSHEFLDYLGRGSAVVSSLELGGCREVEITLFVGFSSSPKFRTG